MRAWRSLHGFTAIELIVAGSIGTVLGGVMLVLATGMSQSYSAQVTLNQLSGYLDTATEQLKRDIWSAIDACSAACPAGLGGPWLALDLPPANFGSGAWGDPDIRYTVDTTAAGNVKLVREQRTGGAWGPKRVVAQSVVQGAGTVASVNGALVTFRIAASKTVSGRAYPRSIPDTSYRRQVPPPP